MSQIETGFRSILRSAKVYRSFQSLIGAGKAKKFCIEKHLSARPNMRVLDLGCGTGSVLPYFPPSTDYCGIDINPAYIGEAKKKYGKRATFLCGDINDAALISLGKFDAILAFGILHHLEDPEALRLCRFARMALKKQGRMLTLDGCYLDGQSRWARFLLSRDRGRNVRTAKEYSSIAEKAFPFVKTSIYHDLLRIPFTFLVMECSLE